MHCEMQCQYRGPVCEMSRAAGREAIIVHWRAMCSGVVFARHRARHGIADALREAAVEPVTLRSNGAVRRFRPAPVEFAQPPLPSPGSFRLIVHLSRSQRWPGASRRSDCAEPCGVRACFVGGYTRARRCAVRTHTARSEATPLNAFPVRSWRLHRLREFMPVDYAATQTMATAITVTGV